MGPSDTISLPGVAGAGSLESVIFLLVLLYRLMLYEGPELDRSKSIRVSELYLLLTLPFIEPGATVDFSELCGLWSRKIPTCSAP